MLYIRSRIEPDAYKSLFYTILIYRERENAERANVQGVYYNNSLRGNGVSFSVPMNSVQLAALDRRAAHSW